MSLPLIAVLALVGLLLGWPLRALVFRYAVPAGTSPRTCCRSCEPPPSPARPFAGSAARPFAPCPACGERAGPAPLAVVVLTAAAFAALAARIHPAPATHVHSGLLLAAACRLAPCAVPLVFIDAAVHRLPDLLTVPAYAGTVVLLLAAAATAPPASPGAAGHPWPVLLRAVLGGVALAAFYLALGLAFPAGHGLG